MFIFDPMYFVFVGPAMLVALFASWRVKSTFNKYSKVGVRSGMTGAQAAAAVARAGGADAGRGCGQHDPGCGGQALLRRADADVS